MSKFRLEGNMTARLDEFDNDMKRAMVAAANYVAPMATEFMRANAPWTDRTGAARNGLQTKVVAGGNKVAIVMYHSVPYGVFLEVRWGGKFAVIPAAMAATGPLFMEVIKRLAFDE